MDELQAKSISPTTEQDDDQEIQGILIHLEELMDSLRKDVKVDCLETAISLLRGALDNGINAGESRVMIFHQIITALLVRYGLYGWIEDLDACLKHLSNDVGSEGIIRFRLGCQNIDENSVELQVPAQLIKACRSSIDIAILDKLVYTATATLDSCKSSSLDGKLTLPIARLSVLLGKALVMRYLHGGEITELNQATQCLQQQALTCTEDSPLALTSSKLLQHIDWLRFVECRDLEALLRLNNYVKKEAAADEEGGNLYKIGVSMIQHAVDDTQLEEGIGLLTTCLHCCVESHPRRGVVLDALANAFMTHFKRVGNYEELRNAIRFHREALDLHRPSHPRRSRSLNNLAACLFARFEYTGELEDLEESISLHQEALDLRPLHHPDRSMTLNDLANSLSTRFGLKGIFEDLEECIVFHREVLELCRPPHPNRSTSLNNLANSLNTRFEHKGGFGDLEECINLHREALNLRPPSHQNRSMSLNNLASSLRTRFEHRGAFEDLEEGITLLREALTLCRPPHPDRSASLNNLANSLFTRFEHKGAFEDLEECITLYGETLELRPPPHPLRSMPLNNLATALRTRFEHRGAFEDLEESIKFHREALHLRPLPHSDRSTSLNNLANTLITRFKRKGAFGDLEECITLHREALNMCPPPHPHRSTSLNNLAISLSIRFEHKGVFEDLEECIILHREALDLRPLPHPERSQSLNDLATSLFTRFHHKGVFEDLEECIDLHEEALHLRSAPHPLRSMSLNNLASALVARFEHTRTPSDNENALVYLQEAAKYPSGLLLNRLDISKEWAICAQKYCPALTLDAYRCSMELLPQLASLDLTIEQRQDVLQHSRDLVGNAAKCAINAGQCELAITFLSTGRSVFWAQALQLRTPVEELKVTHLSLAEKFITVSRQLECASYSQLGSASSSSIVEGATDTEGTYMYPSPFKLVNQRQETIEKIRRIPGYEYFLLPHPFSSLQLAAKNGPVILLNASKLGCDALVMRAAGCPSLEHIPLLDICWEELEAVKMLIHSLLNSGVRSTRIPPEMVDTLQKCLGRDLVPEDSADSNEEIFRLTLESLWFKVVQPVVDKLQMKKTDAPMRIWWCPTGPFSSLPIHAAGVYSAENEPLDCLFQYAVSSYITSPQDLLHSPVQITHSFKMGAIIEPEVVNAGPLPFTIEELKRIGTHIPRQNLVAHVGSKATPNHIADIVSSIQQSSFVHFGCHGTQNLRDPLESCLLLSGGRLTMSRLMKECRVPEGALAYLSACETAKGDEIRPDESLNLVATMMFAGFRSVVGTLWSILDCDAPIVADVFYGHLFRNGKETPPDVTDAAYGLHLATKKLRDEGRPFSSWISYVHYGI